MKRYRPQILSILSFGMGGTVSVGILYMLSLYAPDLFSEIHKGIGGGWSSFFPGGQVGRLVSCFAALSRYSARMHKRA